MNKHLVIYMGSGIWRDKEEKLWGEVDGRDDVVRKRVFKSDKSQADFLNSRNDIKFMIEYGQMSIESIGVDDTDDDKIAGEQVVLDKAEDKKSSGMSITP